MYKIGIIDTINSRGIDLLKSNENFSFEIITDLSRENLLLNLPKFDGVTLRRGKLDSGILEKCGQLRDDINKKNYLTKEDLHHISDCDEKNTPII